MTVGQGRTRESPGAAGNDPASPNRAEMTWSPRPGGHARRSPWPGVAAIVITLVAAMTPVFTVAALATPIEDGLDLSGTSFGLALSGFHAMTAVGSLLAGRLTARISVPAALTAVCVVAAFTLLLATRGAAGLVAALLLGGAGNALTQPVAARYIAARVPDHRLSVATGLTGAALGAAPLLPGLLAAFVAPLYGWKATLAFAAVLAVVAATCAPLARLGPARAPAAPTVSSRPVPARSGARSVLLLWTVGAALATIGSNAVASFFVQIGTASGLPTTVAGTMLALSSALAIVVRVATGITADRVPRRNPRVVAAMMCSGVVGLGLIALHHPVSFVIGAALAVAGGWGWTGLLLTAVMRVLPGQAARAGATVQIGLFSGAALAPLTFGTLATTLGVTAAVMAAAAATLLGAIAVETGTGLLRCRHQQREDDGVKVLTLARATACAPRTLTRLRRDAVATADRNDSDLGGPRPPRGVTGVPCGRGP